LEIDAINYYFVRYKYKYIADVVMYIAGIVDKYEGEIFTVIDIHPFKWLLMETAKDEDCLNQYMLIDFKVISEHEYNLFKEYERSCKKYKWY